MFGNRKKVYCRPSGVIPDGFTIELLKNNHILIGGTSGSGKSTLLDSILYTICTYTPNEKEFCIVDLKRVSLLDWKRVPHCKCYATEPILALKVIEDMTKIIEERYKYMERMGTRKYSGSHLYLIIDEAADLLNNPGINKKVSNNILANLTHICRVGRACSCHIIYCSQQVARSVIPSSIQANCDALVGLRCRSKMESRMIIGEAGCESLPRYGKGYVVTPDLMTPEIRTINKVSDIALDNMINYWTK